MKTGGNDLVVPQGNLGMERWQTSENHQGRQGSGRRAGIIQDHEGAAGLLTGDVRGESLFVVGIIFICPYVVAGEQAAVTLGRRQKSHRLNLFSGQRGSEYTAY